MAKLTSEVEVVCPCCHATLVVDVNLRRVVSRSRPSSRILSEAAARREALFQQSVETEKTKGDALAKRFEEALRQARQEPITKPTRDFDLD